MEHIKHFELVDIDMVNKLSSSKCRIRDYIVDLIIVVDCDFCETGRAGMMWIVLLLLFLLGIVILSGGCRFCCSCPAV